MADELKTERRQAARLTELARERQADMMHFIREAMKVKEGRVFFYELLALCKIGQNGFTGHALTTAFNLGERNIGDQVQAFLIAEAPQNYLKMLTEQQELQNARPNTSTDTGSQAGGDDSGGDDSAGSETRREPTGPFDS